MEAKTVDLKYNIGKTIPICCMENDNLRNLNIQDQCFLLLIIHEGSVSLQCGEEVVDAMGPCLLCFDERKPLKLIRRRNLCCDAVYFHPTFLNANMSFACVHSSGYEELANMHDLFLLKPFITEERLILPMLDDYQASMRFLFFKLAEELEVQSDWYWSCRSRSYFIEIMLLLERIYCSMGGRYVEVTDEVDEFDNTFLKQAVSFIEDHYNEPITLQDIVRSCSINHSTLTALFKSELGITPVAYLWHYRLMIAKKLLEFTNLPVKEVAKRCGFKTVQHFSRKFEEQLGLSPAVFRTQAVARRKASF
jgi:AraC family L-rhamnose operon regulatory protein RhaS